MSPAEKMALVEQTLNRAADELGDVTPQSMARFYGRFPTARATFERLSRGDLAQLEGQMVENSLLCLLNWFESPAEIKIMLSDSVPHHQTTLSVPAEWYGELIDATAEEVVAGTIPADHTQEHAIWDELRSTMQAVIGTAAVEHPTTPF